MDTSMPEACKEMHMTAETEGDWICIIIRQYEWQWYHAVRCILTSLFMIVILTRSMKRKPMQSIWLTVDSQ